MNKTLSLLICLLLLFFACSCAGGLATPPFSHGPLTNSNWNQPAPRRLAKRPAPQNKARPKQDVREKMISEANAWLDLKQSNAGYGFDDLDRIVKSVAGNTGWNSSQGLKALVNLAKKRGAFYTDSKPSGGDIVLFHNLFDANSNSEADDWLTGCGIVVDRSGRKLEAVVRTGHAPRKIIAWPDGPARRLHNGKQINSFLRVPKPSDSKDTAYLAGQLYAGYIDIQRFINN